MRREHLFTVLLWSGLALSLASAASAQGSGPGTGLRLNGERFQVEAFWKDFQGRSGMGQGMKLTDETGYFWFFEPSNVEVFVKVIDACQEPFNRFWVFAGGLTSVEVTLRVTDRETGEEKVYFNPAGQAFLPVQDTDAFATCRVNRGCGQGTSREVSSTPRADLDLEILALFMGGGLTADQEIYDRVAADVSAIHAEEPFLVQAEFVPQYDTQVLLLTVTPEALLQVQAGTYREWDCLNEWYGVESVSPFADNTVLVRFGGVYDTQRLAADYEKLPGVQQVDLDHIFFWVPGLFPDVICGQKDGDTHHYFFVLGDGRPSPRRRSVWYFTSIPGQAPQLQGLRRLGDPEPVWYPRFEQCLRDITPLAAGPG